ncbi:hypothetical protein MPAR168_23485 [Methylorubrum populi]|uniref:Uncharacterized protein n=1 Tax=Methylobacterium radiotolerans TaxID=31998 RepID=A0ABU7TB94_9HYPH
MLGRLFSAVRRSSRRDDPRSPSAVEAQMPVEALQFPPMRPLMPPSPQNDEIDQGVSEVVERDLRAAGYLR